MYCNPQSESAMTLIAGVINNISQMLRHRNRMYLIWTKMPNTLWPTMTTACSNARETALLLLLLLLIKMGQSPPCALFAFGVRPTKRNGIFISSRFKSTVAIV